jgi:hypothetical protein
MRDSALGHPVVGPTFEEMLHPAKIAPEVRRRAQQGKMVEELDAQLDPEWWLREQAKVAKSDRLILSQERSA